MFGVFIGRVLPKSIDGADEIFPLSGVRYSHPMAGTAKQDEDSIERSGAYYDFGAYFGNGEGVSWTGGSAGVSMMIPVETIIGHAGIGVDFTRYETNTTEPKNKGGAHFIGGVLARIGGNVLARFDMKLTTKPGTTLFFALGLTFEMSGGEDKGGG